MPPPLAAALQELRVGRPAAVSGEAAGEERERLVRYARAYLDGSGPNREVVGRWLRYLTSSGS